MSMLLFWTPASADVIAGLLQNPAAIEGFINEAEEIEAADGVDKAWHGLHYMLTGSAAGDQAPHCYLMLGGETIGDIDVGYGPARALGPAEVAHWHHTLSAISDDDFTAKYKPEAMNEAGVYPSIWADEPEQGLSFLLEGFEKLKQSVAGVAATGNGLILWLC